MGKGISTRPPRCARECPGRSHCGDWGGTSKQRGTPCGQLAGYGTDHPGRGLCKLHGGATISGRKQAARAAAEDLVATYGLPVVTTPEQALLDEVHHTAGHVAWLRARIATLDADALVWGLTKTDDIRAAEFTGTNTTEAAAVNVWLQLYQQERKHLVDVCAKTIQAGVAERQVRLAEQQGELMATALGAILDGLGLTDEQQRKVPGLVERHLRVV